MEYAIKRGNSTLVTVEPPGSQDMAIMGGNTVTMSFTLADSILFALGDYVDVYAERYWLNTLPRVEKISEGEYQYNLQFDGIQIELGKYQFRFYGANNKFTKSNFSITGNAATFLSLVAQNANRASSGGWKVGQVDSSDDITLLFSNDNCLNVLSRLAEALKTEFWIDADKTIHLKKREINISLTFKYGQGEGLRRITRDSVKTKPITRLFAEGGTKNIPATYRDYSDRIQLPSPLEYLEKNVNLYGKFEASMTFDDVYPHRVGTVTAVNDNFTFTDTTLDFNLQNQLFPGDSTKAKVIFQTGQLSNYQFEVNAYNDVAKRITLLPNKDEKVSVVPSDVLKAAVGDKYVLVDIIMPPSYITASENLLKEKAQEFLDDNSNPRIQYTVECDPIYFKENNIALLLGGSIRIIDTELNIDQTIRIVSLSRDLQNWYQYTIQLSDSVAVATLQVQNSNKIREAERIIRLNQLSDPIRARLNYKTSHELIDMTFDPDGNYYSGKIKAESIETVSLAIGARSQEFSLINVTFEPNYQGSTAKFKASEGVLEHYSIDPTKIKSWTIAAYNTTSLTAPGPLNIYAKCDKTGTTGIIQLLTDKITVNQDPNYYFFKIGVLHSVFEGVRGISLTFGQTTINGKFIKTGKITSQDGKTYVDLDGNEIVGRFRFINEAGGYDDINDVINNALASYQPDNQVVLWEFAYAPTLTNVPASQWTTNLIKDDHIGDIFLDDSSGVGYKFAKSDTGVYSWNVEPNNALITALKKASLAQATADGKMTVYLGTLNPTVPYSKGDEWVRGATYPVLYATRGRTASEVFTVGDWQKMDHYTDDTIALEAKGIAASAQTAANTANTKIGEIADDNILTPGDKQELLRIWQTYQGEKAQLDAQALKFNVSAAQYDTAYNTLNTYITPLLSSLTTNSNITGTTLRSNNKAYTDAREALRTAINAASFLVEFSRLGATIIDGGQIITDLVNTSAVIVRGLTEAAAKDAVNSIIDVGDRNLLLNSGLSSFTNWSINGSATRSVVADGGRNVTRVNSTAGSDGIYQFIVGKSGRKYSASVEVKALTNPQSILIGIFPTAPKAFTVAPADGWVKIKTTETASANDIAITIYAGAGRSFLVRDAKLQEGSTVTTYTPSPEDVDAKVSNLENSLGNVAYTDLVEWAMTGNTLTVGGFTKTDFIDTDYIKALEFLFTKGKIGEWAINANGITNSNGKSYIKQTSPNNSQTNITIGVQSLINTVFDKTRNSGVTIFNNEPNHNPSPATDPTKYQNFGGIVGAGNSDDDVGFWVTSGATWLSGQFRPQWNTIDHPSNVSSIILPDYVHYVVIKPAITNAVVYLPQKPMHFTQIVIKVRHSTLNTVQVKPHPTGTASTSIRDFIDSTVLFIQIDRTTRALTLFFDGQANEWTVFDR